MSEQSEKQALLIEDDISNRESKKGSDFKFQSLPTETSAKSESGNNLPVIFYLQSLILSSICIIDIVVGSVFLDRTYDTRMLCRFFIIQGACGLFAILVRTCAIVFE